MSSNNSFRLSLRNPERPTLTTSGAHAAALKGYVLTALFAAAAAAGGYLLMAIPNVELFTLVLFSAGFALGPFKGISAALVASFLYFGLNPQGGLFPPLLISQMIGASTAPLAGVLWRNQPHLTTIPGRLLIGLAGFLVTLWYDLVTNLAYPVSAGFDLTQIGTTLVLGIPFAVLHIGSNILVFFFLAPPLLKTISRRHIQF